MKDIGLLLQQTREERGLNIEDAAGELKIRPHYIEAMENGDFSSLSGEIYLTGYLKSYANWLGINGLELTKKLNCDKKAFLVGSKISGDAPSFFIADDNFTTPEIRLTLITFFMAVIIYIFLISSDSPINDYSLYSSPKEQQGIVNLKDDGRQLILMANDRLTVHITGKGGKKTSKQMQQGEIYFLPNTYDSLVTSDKPAFLDIFLDQESDSFLGTLDKI